jgi:hypothetical protein
METILKLQVYQPEKANTAITGSFDEEAPWTEVCACFAT